MNKITLVLVFVLTISFPAHATLWAERQEDYKTQANYCAELNVVTAQFNWEQYQDIAENGDVADFKKLLSGYEEMITEYTLLENEIGVLYYNMMILSLTIVYVNRFDQSSLESDEYKNTLEELDKKTERINNLISQCN